MGHPAGQLAQHRQQGRRRRPLGDRVPGGVGQRLVQHHRAVGGDDERPAPQRAGGATLVALQQPAADGLDDDLGGALLGQPLGDRADAEVQFGVGVLGGVRDVGAHGGVGPGGGEHRLQEGHVHEGESSSVDRFSDGRRPRLDPPSDRLPIDRDLTRRPRITRCRIGGAGVGGQA